MKKLSAVLMGYVASVALSGCDSSTDPTTITVHDTLRIHDTSYLNDRFAGTTAIVHGQWHLTTPTDTADGDIFQIGDSITGDMIWKKAGAKSYTGKIQKVLSDPSSYLNIRLIESNNKIVLTGKLTDSANHKITAISGSVVDKETFVTISDWKGVRTF